MTNSNISSWCLFVTYELSINYLPFVINETGWNPNKNEQETRAFCAQQSVSSMFLHRNAYRLISPLTSNRDIYKTLLILNRRLDALCDSYRGGATSRVWRKGCVYCSLANQPLLCSAKTTTLLVPWRWLPPTGKMPRYLISIYSVLVRLEFKKCMQQNIYATVIYGQNTL